MKNFETSNQNENAISSIDTYVVSYRATLKKSATSILELASVVYEAKVNLSEADYDEFCKQISVDKKSSYLKKLNCIAQKASRFTDYVELLPPNYTTIYTLSKLDEDTFKRVVAANVLSPQMTADDLSEYVEVKQKRTVQIKRFTIDLSKIADDVYEEAYQEILAVCKKFNIELKDNSIANNITAVASTNTAEAANDQRSAA